MARLRACRRCSPGSSMHRGAFTGRRATHRCFSPLWHACMWAISLVGPWVASFGNACLSPTPMPLAKHRLQRSPAVTPVRRSPSKIPRRRHLARSRARRRHASRIARSLVRHPVVRSVGFRLVRRRSSRLPTLGRDRSSPPVRVRSSPILLSLFTSLSPPHVPSSRMWHPVPRGPTRSLEPG